MRPIDADKVLETMRSNMDMQELYLPTHFIDLVIENMPTIEVEPDKGWISVEDRLPENDGLYIVCKTIKGHMICFEAHWKGNKWLSVVKNNQLDYVTHWQPLPEPPKGE